MKQYFEINNQFKKYLPIFIIMLSLVLLLGSSYALLRSSQIGEETYVMNVGLLEVTFLDSQTNALNVTNMVPVTDEEGMETDKELVFTIKNTGDYDARYNLYIEETSTSPEFKTVTRYISNKNDTGYTSPKTLSDDKFLDIMASLRVGETATYKVKCWLDESADATYMDKTFTARVVVEVVQGNVPARYLLEKSIKESTCNPTVEEDGIIYFSGTNDCINFNYVWYSGKLWRITAIYPDGTMKMITDSSITTISWGSKSTVSSSDLTSAYSTSYMREWLNQEFLPTLYNYENIIVEDAGWYSITDSEFTPTKPTGDYTLTDPVGLLNAYEYYMSYKNTIFDSGYLNIGYIWWLITPYSSSLVLDVNGFAELAKSTPASAWYGSRPVVNLKSTIQLSGGSGTQSDPYRIKGDITEAESNITLINTRVSGEYVKLENDYTESLYRIVDTEIITDPETSEEKLTTKIVLNDYVKDTQDTDADGNTTEILTKYFSSGTTLWTEVDKINTTYWRGYLNNTWLAEIDNTYNSETGTSSILEKGTYYLGYHRSGSYKTTVCSAVSSDVTIKQCIENGAIVSNTSSDDYVGLLRVGEMFSSQTRDYTYSDASNHWLITPYGSSYVHNVDIGALHYNHPSSYSYGSRPSINLTSEILIKSGSGTKQDPFVVGLPETE